MITLQNLLNAHGIDTSVWGQGKAKTLQDLLQELQKEESVLKVSNGKLFRHLSVLGVHVYYDAPHEGWLRAFEEKQVFRDGRERLRGYLTASVSEKLFAHELPVTPEVVQRALREELQTLEGEELGFHEFEFLKYEGVETEESDSPSFPGLPSVYETTTYIVGLMPEDFRREGYSEVQVRKTTYFKWREANSEEISLVA